MPVGLNPMIRSELAGILLSNQQSAEVMKK